MKKLFKKDSGEENNFWMSYTDLMSGFLVVFIILSAILFNHFTKKAEEAEAARVKYDELIEKYNKAIYELENSGRDIDSCLVANSKLKSQIDSLTYIVDSLRKNDMKNLITQYRSVFVYDPNIKVTIDTSRGSIILTHQNSSKDLFVSGYDYVYGDLKAYLDKVGKNIVTKTIELYNSGYKNIELRIEGHTDPRWSGYSEDDRFLMNLDLSSRRANNVYEYILKNTGLNDYQKRFVKKHMIGIGYSFSHRLLDNSETDTSKDPSSRRIEFRIISK